MRQILLAIDGTAKTCQKSVAPSKPGPNGNTDYLQGDCPYLRRSPNGKNPVCLIYQRDVRTPRSLEEMENGFTKRLPECCAAEKDAGKDGFIQINIAAGARFCEKVPIIKIEKKSDPWISQTAGYETLFYPDQVCQYYVSFPNAYSGCRIHHQSLSRSSKDQTIELPGVRLVHSFNGLTKRLHACIRAEEEQKK